MALQVDRFVTPEQDFAGLYRYSGRLEQNRLRQEQEKQAAAGRKAASDKYFANYLDPKEWFTGTVADGVIHNMIGEALGQAFKLSADGASDNQIFTAISPIVNRANEYSAKAKNIQLQKKQALDIVGKRKGVDVIKFSNEFDDEVFMETDPITGVKKMRDLSLIDPSQNYADKVLSTRDVFNTEGFDEFISKSKSVTGNLSTKLTDAKKGMRAVKLSVTAPEYMEPVIVNGVFQQRFQPRHEVFTDNGEVVEEPEFDIDGNPVIGSNGKQSKTPVKMVTKDDWGPLLRNPGTGAYLRQEVKKYANKLGVDPAGPQAEHFGRALAWKLIDQSTQSRGTYSEMVEQKAQPAPRITVNVNNGGDTQKVNDIYGRIDKEVQRLKDYGEDKTPGTLLDADAQTVVLDFVNKGRGEGDKLLIEDIRITKSPKGELLVFDTDGNLKTTLPKVGTNLKVQPSVKEKREVIKDGDKPSPKKDPLGIL